MRAGGGAVEGQGGRVAIVAITRHGAEWGARLQGHLPGSRLFVAERFAAVARAAGAAVSPFSGPVRGLVAERFREYDAWVLFVALGAVVRILAPCLRDKKSDPGVVVVDDRARFAISVLSGHLGGANSLARRVAGALGAQAVVTTASDAAETIAVDLLGREFGWTIEDDGFVTAASAAVVNEEPVAVCQEAGERGWWPADRPLPANVHLYASLEEAALAGCAAALIITDRLLPAPAGGSEETARAGSAGVAGLLRRAVVYRPKSLVVGVGCNRGTAREEIAAAVEGVLAEYGLSLLSVRSLATVEAKRGEPGLVEYAAARGLPLLFFPAAELDAVAARAAPNPSPAPLKYVGTRGVCEPAALLAAGAAELVVEKQKRGNVTVAVARVPFR